MPRSTPSPVSPAFLPLHLFRLLVVWLGLFLCVVPFACQKKDRTGEEKSGTAPAAVVASADTSTRTFSGTIGGKYAVVMHLHRQGAGLTGSYAYTKVGRAIRIIGKIGEDGTFTLRESDDKGQVTGTFEGRVTTQGQITGTWQKLGSNNPLSLALREMPGGTVPEAMEQDTVSVVEHTFSVKGPNDTEAQFSFPRVSGPLPREVLARLNEHLSVKQLTDMTEPEIKKTFGECGCGLVNIDFTILYNQNGILCIEATREWLGAYSSFSAERLVLSTATGEPLTIGQLLQPAALPDLARQCDKLLQERMEDARREVSQDEESSQLLAELLAGKTFTAAHLEAFTVSKDGITFYYPFGFPHVATALEPDNAFHFSFAQLKPYLKPGGPLAPERE